MSAACIEYILAVTCGFVNYIYKKQSRLWHSGRAVAYDTRDPRFDSSHWQFLFNVRFIERTKIKKTRPVKVHF